MIGRNEQLFEHVYLLMRVHSKVGLIPGLIKMLFFFTVHMLLILQPTALRKSEKLNNTLFYFNAAYSALVIVCLITLVLGRESRHKKLVAMFVAVLLYPWDYVMLPLKVCSFISQLQGDAVLMFVMLADVLFAGVLTQIHASLLRDLNPSDANFLSMLDTSLENWLFLLAPLQVIILAFIADLSPTRSTQEAILTWFRMALSPLLGGFLLGLMLLRRPFCHPIVERVFACSLLFSFGVCTLFEIFDTFSGMVRCSLFIIPVGVFILLKCLDKQRFGRLSVSTDSPPITDIKDLLAQGLDSTAKIFRQGQYRALLINNKQFKELLERMTSVLRQLAGPDLSTPGGLADMIMMRLPTLANISIPKSPISLANQKLLHNIAEHPLRPTILANKQEEEIVPEQKEDKKPHVQLQSNLAMSPEEAMMLQISDEEIESHIIDLYLSNSKKPYHIFLRLMWMIRRRPSLVLIFTALAELKQFNAKFRSNYLLYFAKREVEAFLLNFDVAGKKQSFSRITKLLGKERKPLVSQQSLKKGSVTVGTSQFQGGFGTAGISEFVQTANTRAGKKEFKYQMARAAEEYVDLAHVFYYKNTLKKLVHDIKEFSKLNREYVELITLPQQDLYHRTRISRSLYELDIEIQSEYQDLLTVSGDYEFQHLIPYYYHLHYNTNRHNSSERQFSEVSQKVASVQGLRQRNLKQPLNSNLINETVCLLIESQISRFGTIIEAYGKINMLMDTNDSLIGQSYQIFMNDSMKQMHDQVTVGLYESPLLGHHGEQLTKVKTGMVKVPFRNLLVPSHVLLKLCPFSDTGFKFIVSVKPDFTDNRLFFSVDRQLQVDGYSLTLLNLVEERYLAPKVPLELMMNTTYQNILQVKQGYEQHIYQQHDAEAKLRQKTGKTEKQERPPLAARARAGSTRTTNLQNLIAAGGRPIENRSQTYGMEDGRSARSRSLINSALPSGITHNLLAPTEVSKDFVQEEKVRFFAEVQEDVPASVRLMQAQQLKESKQSRRKSVAIPVAPKIANLDKPYNESEFIERSLKITAKYHSFVSDYARMVGVQGHWVMHFHQQNNMFGTSPFSLDAHQDQGAEYSLSGNPGGQGLIHSNTPSGQKTLDRDKGQTAGNSHLHNSPVNPNNSDMGSSISRAVNSHLFKDEQEAQNRKPAMSIFGQGMKNKKKSFDVSDDVGKANRTLRFQSEAGHNEIIGRQKTNNNLPEHKDPERIKLVSNFIQNEGHGNGEPQDSEESKHERKNHKLGTQMFLEQGGINSIAPKRRQQKRSSRKQTIISSKRNEFESKEKKLEKEWQRNNAISGQVAEKLQQSSQEFLQERAGESLFKKVQEKVEQKTQLKSTVALFLILLLVNLTNIIFLIGLNVLLSFGINKYDLFLEGLVYMSDNMLNHRNYHHSFVMEIGLAKNLMSSNRYAELAKQTGNSTYQNLSMYLRIQRQNFFTKVRSTSELLLKQAENNYVMEQFYFNQANYTVGDMQTDNDQLVSKWPFISGIVFKVTNLLVDLQGQLEEYSAQLNKADLVESTVRKSYLSYVSNYLRGNRETASQAFGQKQLDDFVSLTDYVPYMIYGLVGIIVIMLILTIISFVLILQQFERIHKSFAFLSLRDAQERLAQLKVVSFQMQTIEQSQYYYTNVLEERYMMSTDETDATSKTSVLPPMSKHSQQIFANIRLSVGLISFFYLLLAGICFAGGFLFSSRLVMVKWYHEKVVLSETLANNYLDYFNDLKTLLVLGDTVQYQLQSQQSYFENFDVKINQNLRIGTDLPSDSAKYPDSQDASITNYLRNLFTGNICSQVPAQVAELCGKIDSEYTSKGMSQITSRLSSFYKQTYIEFLNPNKSRSQILNDVGFIQVEAAAHSLYFPLMFEVYNKLVNASKTYLQGSFSTTGLVFSLLYLLAMLLFTAFSSLPYLSVLQEIKIVNFSFLLLSLNTYLRNVQLRQLMQEYLQLKYY